MKVATPVTLHPRPYQALTLTHGAPVVGEDRADARSRMKSATLVPYGSVKPSLWNQSAAMWAYQTTSFVDEPSDPSVVSGGTDSVV